MVEFVLILLKQLGEIWLALYQATGNEVYALGVLVPDCICFHNTYFFSPPVLFFFFFKQRFPFTGIVPIMCSPISMNSACPTSSQMNKQFARCWLKGKSVNVYERLVTLKKEISKADKIPSPFLYNPTAWVLVHPLSLMPHLFNREWTSAWKAARKTLASRICMKRMPHESLFLLLHSSVSESPAAGIWMM